MVPRSSLVHSMIQCDICVHVSIHICVCVNGEGGGEEVADIPLQSGHDEVLLEE